MQNKNAEERNMRYNRQQSVYARGTQNIKQKIMNIIQSSDIDELYRAEERLKVFASRVGMEKFTGLRQDVLEHCQKIKSRKNDLSYEKIERMVKNRIQKMIKNKRIKKNWSEEDIYILIWIISKYCDLIKIGNIDKGLEEQDWKNIAELIPGTDKQSCMFKWLSLRKNRLADYSWSEKQSATLNKIVKQNEQQDWTEISQQLYYMNSSSNKVYRCPKQCRQHWNCYLNPNLKKGPWTNEEDITLLCEIKRKDGLKRWSDMVRLFNGRTENALKNRYNLIMEKERSQGHGYQHLTELELINNFLQRNQVYEYSNSNLKVRIEEEKRYKILMKKSEQESPEISQEVVEKRILRKREKKIKILDSSYNEQQQQEKVRKVKGNSRGLEPKNSLMKEGGNSPAISVQQVESVQDFEISPFEAPVNTHETPKSPPNTNHYSQQFPKQVPKNQESSPQYTDLIIRQNTDMNDILPTDLQKIRIVPMKEHDVIKLKQILTGLSKGEIKDLSFVPCKIIQNKLTKFNY